MNRPLIIGILGGVIAIAAIILTFSIERGPDEPPVSRSPSAPADRAAKPADGLKRRPGLTAPAVVEQPTRPSFDVVRVNPRGDAVIAGRAEPDAEVTIREGSTERAGGPLPASSPLRSLPGLLGDRELEEQLKTAEGDLPASCATQGEVEGLGLGEMFQTDA